MNELIKIIPQNFVKYLSKNGLEEIRIRRNKPLAIRVNNKIFLETEIICTDTDIKKIMQNATNYSFHTYLEYLKNGFITLKGGHRLGICGEILCEDDKILNFKDITSINLRIAKKNIKIDENILKSTHFKNTLVISPPNMGKTTLLREIIKYLSNKNCNISVIDERFEISGGNDSFDLGFNTDVILGLTKNKASMMMLKTMSPDYIVLDEITTDTEILQNITNCGVKVIATIHSDNLKTLRKRDKYNSTIQYFDNFIEITEQNGQRKYNILGSD